MKLIHLRAPYMFVFILVVFGGPFGDNFCVLEIFKNGFGMRMCNFGCVCFVKIMLFRAIYLRDPYIIFGYLVNFGSPFWGPFGVFEIFENVLERCVTSGRGLFSEIYSFESPFYDFWIVSVFGGFFFGVIFRY